VLDENASIIFEQVLEVFAEMTELTLINTIKKNKQTFENTQ